MQQIEIKEDTSALLKNYSRYDVEFEKGNGCYLYDSYGKEYLDFLSGIAVTGFGHNHPAIMKTMEEQIHKVWHTSNLFSSSLQEKAAEKLVSHSGLDYVFFCNSGTEANEAAIKFARKWGNGKYEIIAADGGFHGRTMGSLAATGQPKFWEGFTPVVPGFKFVPYNNADELEKAVDEKTCAILLEPIQGESGIIVPDYGYLKQVREICDRKNILLIIDEVQSGMGRTGKFFAHQWEDIKPDIITVAKGIANGIPLGATICTDDVAKGMVPGTHGSTFGGNPIAVALASTIMDLLSEEVLNKNISDGELIKEKIKSLNHKDIVTVRGKGLMLGVVFNESFDAKKLAKELLANGLTVGTSGPNIIRLLPPFIISETEINKFGEIFSCTLNSLA